MFHDRELTTATARLIAAAPDLLAALECWPLTELIEMADDRVLTRLKWFVEIRAEALKKACGDEPNVKEHATLSAGARVDHGIEVKTTGKHVNRAADRGCCVSTCSASCV